MRPPRGCACGARAVARFPGFSVAAWLCQLLWQQRVTHPALGADERGCRSQRGRVFQRGHEFPQRLPQLAAVRALHVRSVAPQRCARSRRRLGAQPLTAVDHAAVYPDGRVCISILHSPGDDPSGYELASERWSPVQTVETIMLSIISMLSSPNDESPANIDAAKQWRDDRDGFKKAVARVVRKSQEAL